MLQWTALPVASQRRSGGSMGTAHDDWTVGFYSYQAVIVVRFSADKTRRGAGDSEERAWKLAMETDEQT
jgi:hypothetical protein